jgi:hypothetical protein
MVDGSGCPRNESENEGTFRDVDLVVPGMTAQREDPVESLMAQLIGTLEIDTSTNCLVVRIAVGTRDRLIDVDVAWPPGWSVAVRGGEVVLIDAAGQTIRRLGDEVWVGGGFVDADQANVVSCTGRRQVFVASGFSGP